MDSIKKKINNITVTVDYRTELLGIIMWLSDYHNKFPHLFLDYENQFYTDNILNRFSKYKSDTIIKQFNELVQVHSFSYDAPFALFLELDKHFKTPSLSDYILCKRLNNDKTVYSFINKLEDFSNKINFEDYYNNNELEYQKWVNSVADTFSKNDIVTFSKEYFGYESKSLYINLLPFTTSGNYSCFTGDNIYLCLSVGKSGKKENLFNYQNCENSKVVLAFHEYAHTYVNPITEQFFLKNNQNSLFNDIKEIMSSRAYFTSDTILNEHIIRALEIRYIMLMYQDEQWAKEKLNQEKERGFIYIEPIIDSLYEYENNRDIYETFEMFYPKIIDKLENIYQNTLRQTK